MVGPERVYGTSGLYKNLMFAFLVGAGLTVIAWAVKRKWPNRITKCMFSLLETRNHTDDLAVNVPVIIAGAQYFGKSSVTLARKQLMR